MLFNFFINKTDKNSSYTRTLDFIEMPNLKPPSLAHLLQKHPNIWDHSSLFRESAISYNSTYRAICKLPPIIVSESSFSILALPQGTLIGLSLLSSKYGLYYRYFWIQGRIANMQSHLPEMLITFGFPFLQSSAIISHKNWMLRSVDETPYLAIVSKFKFWGQKIDKTIYISWYYAGAVMTTAIKIIKIYIKSNPSIILIKQRFFRHAESRSGLDLVFWAIFVPSGGIGNSLS